MESSTVTVKGQILVPKRLRTKYGIEPNQKVAFIETKDGVLIKPLDEKYFDRFMGMFEHDGPSTSEYLKWKKEDIELEERSLRKKDTKK